MQRTTIEAGKSESQYWKDLWSYRELFYFLAWRDILIRYKQTVVGIAWAVLRPLATIAILVFVFSSVAGLPSDDVPYPLMVCCGMLPWQFFSTALTESSRSLVSNAGMVSKVYFPKLIVPVSSIITSFVDFLITACIVGLMMVYYQHLPGIRILMLPLFIALAFGCALGAGVWISGLMVSYRDFRIIVPFIVQFGLYLSPVGFSNDAVPEAYQFVYSLNPMVGVIDGFRWAILGGEHTINWASFGISTIGVVLLIASGIWYFRKTEKTFADFI